MTRQSTPQAYCTSNGKSNPNPATSATLTKESKFNSPIVHDPIHCNTNLLWRTRKAQMRTRGSGHTGIHVTEQCPIGVYPRKAAPVRWLGILGHAVSADFRARAHLKQIMYSCGCVSPKAMTPGLAVWPTSSNTWDGSMFTGARPSVRGEVGDLSVTLTKQIAHGYLPTAVGYPPTAVGYPPASLTNRRQLAFNRSRLPFNRRGLHANRRRFPLGLTTCTPPCTARTLAAKKNGCRASAARQQNGWRAVRGQLKADGTGLTGTLKRVYRGGGLTRGHAHTRPTGGSQGPSNTPCTIAHVPGAPAMHLRPGICSNFATSGPRPLLARGSQADTSATP